MLNCIFITVKLITEMPYKLSDSDPELSSLWINYQHIILCLFPCCVFCPLPLPAPTFYLFCLLKVTILRPFTSFCTYLLPLLFAEGHNFESLKVYSLQAGSSLNTEKSREDVSNLFSNLVESSQERPKPSNLVGSLGEVPESMNYGASFEDSTSLVTVFVFLAKRLSKKFVKQCLSHSNLLALLKLRSL